MTSAAKRLDQHKLLRIKRIFRSRFGLSLQLIDLDGQSLWTTEADRASQPLCSLLAKDPAACARCQLDRRRAMQTAFALGDSYTFVCHAGLLVNCTPLMHGDERLGALLSGQTLPESFNETLAQETAERLKTFALGQAAIASALKDHLYVPGQVLQKAGAFLFQLTRKTLRLDMRTLTEQREQAQQQAQIAETIYAIKQRAGAGDVLYPYEREKELLQKVKAGDRLGAKAILNQILGTILFRDPVGSPMFKIRLIELLVVVSRAAAEAGVDVQRVLARSLTNIRKVLRSRDHSDLCVTISAALNEFLDIVCSNREAQMPTPLTAVTAYIEKNYDRNLSVAELARQAHLSPSRVSHLFKEKFGLSLIDQLTRVRIDNAKKLLLETNLSCLEIAAEVGYQEQAHFTRVFRRLEKVTPRRYRALNRGERS
jgi:two-component system response regulator YesN